MYNTRLATEGADTLGLCEGCGEFPAGNRQYETLTRKYQKWVVDNFGKKLFASKLLVHCCANCTRDTLWPERKTSHPWHKAHGPHCTCRLPRYDCDSFLRSLEKATVVDIGTGTDVEQSHLKIDELKNTAEEGHPGGLCATAATPPAICVSSAASSAATSSAGLSDAARHLEIMCLFEELVMLNDIGDDRRDVMLSSASDLAWKIVARDSGALADDEFEELLDAFVEEIVETLYDEGLPLFQFDESQAFKVKVKVPRHVF